MADFKYKRGDSVWVTGPQGQTLDVIKDRAVVMGINVYYLTTYRSRGAVPEFALEAHVAPNVPVA